MAAYEKITAEQALGELAEGALLVNGYDDEQRWEITRVPGAVSYMDFASHLRDLPRDAELMFYCA
jgi:hypothetical protein